MRHLRVTPLRRLYRRLTAPAGRRYLYRLGLAVVGLLVGYGFLAEERALLWVALLGPLLSLASANVQEDHP